MQEASPEEAYPEGGNRRRADRPRGWSWAHRGQIGDDWIVRDLNESEDEEEIEQKIEKGEQGSRGNMKSLLDSDSDDDDDAS
jgi:hypothetical protein